MLWNQQLLSLTTRIRWAVDVPQRHIFRRMSSIADTLIAIVQLTSTSDKNKNLKTAKNLIADSAAIGAKVVFLPECFDYVGDSKEQSLDFAESIDGPTIAAYQEIAVKENVWLSLGGFHEKGPGEVERKVYNTHLLIDDFGKIAGKYRKTHLFNVDVPGGAIMKESDYVIPGNEAGKPIETPVGKIGLQVCYDLRFPELSISQAQLGADILTFPSAFTVPTGMAHWEVLLRARAIENQCYVVAAAQTGKHNKNRQSYGHSMVVDPWGAIIAQCQEGPSISIASINNDYLRRTRQAMPVWKHRRNDIYNNPLK